MEVREKIVEFKTLTEKLIEDLNCDNIDNLENMLFKRQQIINDLCKIKDFNIKEVSKDMELLQLENNLNKVYIEKKDKYKQKMSENNQSIKVNKTYGNNVSKINGLVNLKI